MGNWMGTPKARGGGHHHVNTGRAGGRSRGFGAGALVKEYVDYETETVYGGYKGAGHAGTTTTTTTTQQSGGGLPVSSSYSQVENVFMGGQQPGGGLPVSSSYSQVENVFM